VRVLDHPACILQYSTCSLQRKRNTKDVILLSELQYSQTLFHYLLIVFGLRVMDEEV